MLKGFKIRIYPTKEQEQLLWRNIGACRYMWNYMLDLQQKRYKAGEKYLSAFSMINLITPLKQDSEHEWLCGIPRSSLSRVCQDLSGAYHRMFEKIAMEPKFKTRKRSKPAYPIGSDRFYFKDNAHVYVEKVGKVKFKSDFDFPIGRNHKFCDPRVSFDNNKWFVSFSIECETQTPVLTDKLMGIDLGIKELAVVAVDNEQYVFHNINKSQDVRNLEKKQKHLQRSISRKYRQNKQGNTFVKTKNIERDEEKVRKIYRRIANIRMNYIHQTTHMLVTMLPKRVVMEDLKVLNMVKNKHLAKAIYEQCFYEFKRQMEYKCAWNGIEFVKANTFYPSSKTCSCCGNVKKDLTLKDRVYKCDVCGTVIDRDFNAALNLSRYVA